MLRERADEASQPGRQGLASLVEPTHMSSSEVAGAGSIEASCVGATCARLSFRVPAECLALAVLVRPRECAALMAEGDRVLAEANELQTQHAR
eukprot:COSAG03_NODE_16385_length_403_cov_1.355263_1_plen_92_part_10